MSDCTGSGPGVNNNKIDKLKLNNNNRGSKLTNIDRLVLMNQSHTSHVTITSHNGNLLINMDD